MTSKTETETTASVRKRMQAVKQKDTPLELRLRQALWRRGYRYRKNYAKLPGKPDVVLVGPRIAIFCDGDFWHGRDWENRKHDFRANADVWIAKIERTMERDQEVTRRLTAEGWTVLRFWGSDIQRNVEGCVAEVDRAASCTE